MVGQKTESKKKPKKSLHTKSTSEFKGDWENMIPKPGIQAEGQGSWVPVYIGMFCIGIDGLPSSLLLSRQRRPGITEKLPPNEVGTFLGGGKKAMEEL